MLVSKSGTMKFREERILRSAGFHNRYFILDSKFLRMFKEVRVRFLDSLCTVCVLFYSCQSCWQALSPSGSQKDRADREWEVKSLKVYLGIKKKLRPPTRWECVLCDRCHFLSPLCPLNPKQLFQRKTVGHKSTFSLLYYVYFYSTCF